MAQLTDDLFSLPGPLLPIADMDRMIAERVQPATDAGTVPLAAAPGRRHPEHRLPSHAPAAACHVTIAWKPGL